MDVSEYVGLIDSMVQQCLKQTEGLFDIGAEAADIPHSYRDYQQARDAEISSLLTRIPDLQKKLQATRENTAQLEKEHDELKKELHKLTEENTLKAKQLKKIQKEIRDCSYNISKAEEKLQPAAKHQEVLSGHRKELIAYKRMTGISWLLKSPEHIVAGMVTNMSTNYLKTFEFDLNKTPRARIQEALWTYMWESSLTGLQMIKP